MDIFDVADHFLECYDIDPRKGQWFKYLELSGLCYLYQAMYLASFQEKAFDTRFEGWIHGPCSVEIKDNFDEIVENIGQSNYEFSDRELHLFSLVNEFVTQGETGDLSSLGAVRHVVIRKMCQSTKAYKESRRGLSELDPSREKIDEGLLYDEFSSLLVSGYVCPKCESSVTGQLSSQDNMNILNCGECSTEFIYTNQGDYFIKEEIEC